MDVEFTARQVKISKTLKSNAVEGIERIAISLGKVTSAALIFKAERHLQIVEISLQSKQHSIVSKGESPSQEIALRDALAHAEHQAHRFRDKLRASKRLPKVAPTAETRGPRKTGRPGVEIAAEVEKPPIVRPPGKKTKAAITVHSFPGKPAVVEPHILSAAEALAIRPMTIEEAVKEAEFRDRDLLIFRSATGDLFVLHRRRDGKMELVEVP
ncbi:HPF/RaiA family ribosome-associated protein [Acidicapsa ligni]|uniref:HPF/RaiA family ribosome-associated protein n=1 Tax=Acidicapsa ligni TaxID=542300 RepID=UPI0021E00565|nr:sigma 54 modulation/S30EA ribosomal C-terminal domain-containing protein [Acidicapsa ligni]